MNIEEVLNKPVILWINNLSIYLTIISFSFTLIGFLFTVCIFFKTKSIHLLYENKASFRVVYKEIISLRMETKRISESSQFDPKDFYKVMKDIDGVLRVYKGDKEIKNYIKDFRKNIKEIYKMNVKSLSKENAIDYHCEFSKLCSSLQIYSEVQLNVINKG